MYYPTQQQNPRDERLARLATLAHISAQQDAQDSNSQAALVEQMKTMYGLQQDSQLAPERLRAMQLENTGRDIANRTSQETLEYNPQMHAAMLRNLGLEGTGHELANANAQEMLQYNPQAHAAALAESAAAIGAHNAQTHEAERRTTAIGSDTDLNTERTNLSRQRERILRLQELQYLEQGSGKPLTPQQREMYLQGSPYASVVAGSQPQDAYGPDSNTPNTPLPLTTPRTLGSDIGSGLATIPESVGNTLTYPFRALNTGLKTPRGQPIPHTDFTYFGQYNPYLQRGGGGGTW